MEILLYPIAPALVFGTLSYLYWRKRGYSNFAQFFLSVILFYVIFYGLFKLIL